MRFAIAHPCFGSSETVFKIRRSSVPCTRSFGFAILWLSTISIVDCQGMDIRQWSLLRYLGDQRDSTGSRDLRVTGRRSLPLNWGLAWRGESGTGRSGIIKVQRSRLSDSSAPDRCVASSMSSDPYVYPGTTVLKNIPGIRNREILDRFEANRVGQRSLELSQRA